MYDLENSAYSASNYLYDPESSFCPNYFRMSLKTAAQNTNTLC